MIETRAQRIRRLTHRACYTGMKETDAILGGFARAHLAGMDDGGLDAFEELLACGDTHIRDWVLGREEIPARFAHTAIGDLIAQLKAQRMQ